MTKDEFVLTLLKDNHAMYRVIFLLCVCATAAAIVMAGVVMFVVRKPEGAAVLLGMAACFAIQATTARAQRKAYADALAEVGDVPQGIADNHSYSLKTSSLISQSWHPAKTYFSMVLAYGICGIMMYAGAAVLFLLAGEEGLVFAALGALLLVGALWLTVLAAQAFRNWRTAKRFEAEEE